LLEYLTTLKLYFNLEFDKTSRCPIDVYARFYYDVFYTPMMVMVGLYMAFAVWWLFVRANSKFNLLGRFWALVNAVSLGKLGQKQVKRHWRTELKFHRYQAQRAQWLVYLYIYAPLTRKCSSVFFCRDDIIKDNSYMKSDVSANCDDSRYYVMWMFAVIMFILVGFVIPIVVFWHLYYNPNHWHCHDDENRIFSVGDFVAYRSPRVFYSRLSTSIVINVNAQLVDFAPGSTQRVALEREAIEEGASLFDIEAMRVSVTGIREKLVEDTHACAKQGRLRWLKRSDGEDKWIKCSVRLEGNRLSWRSTMVVSGELPPQCTSLICWLRTLCAQQSRALAGDKSIEDSTTVPTSVSLWKDRTDQSVDEDGHAGDHGYR
jgi:hypothetical protein